MAKARVASRTRVIEDVPEFTVHVPVGTERLVLQKAVIRKLLQAHSNLEVDDFSVIEENGTQKFELLFSPEV